MALRVSAANWTTRLPFDDTRWVSAAESRLAPSADAVGSFAAVQLVNASSVVLVHRRGRRFRPLCLIEIPLFGSCFLVLIPVVFILSEGNAEGELSLPTFRVFNYHHQVDVVGLDAQGAATAMGSFVAPDQSTLDRVFSTLLLWARAQGRVLFEELEAVDGKGARELSSAWYGGAPLFEPPQQIEETRAVAELEFAGLRVNGDDASLKIEVPGQARSRVSAWFVLSLFWLPLALFARATLRRRWLDARAIPPEAHHFEVRAEGVRVSQRRGELLLSEFVLAGTELLGFAFSDSLGFDRNVSRRGPALRIVGVSATRWLRLPKIDEYGAALRDVLISSTLRLRALRPELGLPFGHHQPTHCPFCSTLFVLTPGAQCPGCGAPAGAGRHY